MHRRRHLALDGRPASATGVGSTGRQPQLGDRKRQSASIYLWAHVTGTGHVVAPHPLRDQQLADQPNALRISDYASGPGFQKLCTRPHDIALRTLLDAYAGRLATHDST